MLLFKKLILIIAFKIDFIYRVPVPYQLKNNKKKNIKCALNKSMGFNL